MGFCAVDDKKEQQLMVVWDLGRRCTYACSYCPPHRKNNWSATAKLDELKTTADSLERYSNIYNTMRNKPFRIATSFTGGEPTVNPSFFPFIEYLQERYPEWRRTLTTNGFYSKRKLEIIMATTDFTTVSWHCEGTPEQKVQVRKNLQTMMDCGYNYKINIMFHNRPDYYQECIELAQWCDHNNVMYTPRVIGDQGDIKQGLKDKTVHIYTDDQLNWMKRFWEAKKSRSKTPANDASRLRAASLPGVMMLVTETPKKTVGQTIGRPCCGGRDLDLLVNEEWTKGTFVYDNNFKGWSCMINWYFLYLHQEIDVVWHHQTCQVNLDGKIGPISSVSKFDEYCDKLEAQVATGHIPYIRCPKSHCGCGLCTPKAKHDQLAEHMFRSHAPGIEPDFMEVQDITESVGSLKALVYAFDKKNENETI